VIHVSRARALSQRVTRPHLVLGRSMRVTHIFTALDLGSLIAISTSKETSTTSPGLL